MVPLKSCKKFTIFKGQYIDLKHASGVGTSDSTTQSNCVISLKIERGCVYKKVSGSAMIIFVLYIHDILLIRNGSECIRFQHDCLLNSRWRILWDDTIVSYIYAIERIIYDMLYTKPHIYISYSKKHL